MNKNSIYKYISIFFLVIFCLLFVRSEVHAVSYSLIPPSGQLSRGQNVDFTITIDSQGETVNSTQIGMSYESQYLEYVNTTPGDAMSTISVTQQTDNKLLFSASSTTGFTGSDDFAVVTFKIIAEAPGTANLCVLFQLTPTPTSPATLPSATSAPGIPQPTSLPATGSFDNLNNTLGLGLLLIAGASLAVMAVSKQKQK